MISYTGKGLEPIKYKCTIIIPYSNKTFAVKKFGKKGYCKVFAEKTLAKSLSFPYAYQIEISATLPFR